MSHDYDPNQSAAEHWEERYANADRRWSGMPNKTTTAVLVAVVPPPTPGVTALDIGCGEGADVVWLAEHGWTVTGVDISPTAIARGERAAKSRGVGERVTLKVMDVANEEMPEGPFDLVVASFLHSQAELPRIEILRNGAKRVVPGGHLLIVGHTAPPPWSSHDPADFHMPQDDWATLGLPEDEWELIHAETLTRPTTGHDGFAAELVDGVIIAQRR